VSVEKRLTEHERENIRMMVNRAGEGIARCWPLRTFIYRNPLQGLEHLPFDDAIWQGRAMFGGQGYLANEKYRSLYHAGRISEEAILEALQRSGILPQHDLAVQIGNRCVEAVKILQIHLIYGIEATDASTFHWKAVQEGAIRQYRIDVPENGRRNPESDLIRSLWSSILDAMKLPDPFLSDERQVHTHSFLPSSSNGNRWGFLLRDLSRIGPSLTAGEWIQSLTGTRLVDQINDQMIKWCSAFLDEGMAAWPLPSRDQGLYGAWRDLAPYDYSAWFLGIRDVSQKIRQLPEFPEDLIAGSLKRLGIGDEFWTHYLSRHLAQLPGWTGFIKWRAGESDYRWQKQYPIDLTQYLAIRLFYEAELIEAICRKRWGIGGTVAELQAHFRKHPDPSPPDPKRQDFQDRDSRQLFHDAWRLFHLAQFLGLTADDIRQLYGKEIQRILGWLNSFPSKRHGPVWLEALERSYSRGLLFKLSDRKQEKSNSAQNRPLAQVVFCIDARSEGLRRHLEGMGNYETFGFAGFFGVPICYRPYGSDEEQLLCPALIKPKQVILERPQPDHQKEAHRHEIGLRWHHFSHGLFHDLKANNWTAYFLIDLFGTLFGLSFIAKTLFPTAYHRLREKIHGWLHPQVPTSLLIDRPSEDRKDPALSRFGFTVMEQASFVENGLRMIGLIRNFTRLVLLCAHGSTSENNPYAAAYDCGACGGNHGGPNARLLATMANKPAVRAILRERGIHIPEDTIFIAGEHNTTTDRVMLLDEGQIPPSYHSETTRLMNDLRHTGMRLAQERANRLPGSPKTEFPEQAFRHVEHRSVDWSQVRPEWGLSSNAAFIVGRRTLTRGINLEGRVFMHSYDHEQDRNGKSLETIMTAPLLVVQWISMEYYFSSVDPWVYGSGTKVLHNVAGGIGVMLGRQSDLRPGLPMQSVMDGNRLYHEPMRPLVIIEAPTARVLEIISRHVVLQQLFDNRWVNLVVLDSSVDTFQEYQPGGHWEEICLESKGFERCKA
jgi:uncharacterized protein YbcC (UPF0753/DUF2309 family)